MKHCYLLVLALVLCACSSRPAATAERAVDPKNAAQVAPLEASGSIPPAPASSVEVDAVLRRNFGSGVVSRTQEGSFVTGDFNGDGSQDLAVVVRFGRSKLDTINDPLSNWTIQDAAQAFLPSGSQRVVFRTRGARTVVRPKEPLIAVVHGTGSQGWRDALARQTYLVRNAGRGPLHAVPAPGHIQGAPVFMERSQIIYEDSLRPGFLFWTGSQYAWEPSQRKQRHR